MTIRKFVLAATAMGLLSGPALAQDNEYADALNEIANGQLRTIAENPALVAAIKAQNAETAGYDAAKIEELDQQWRAEVDAGSKPLIDEVMGTEASQMLMAEQESAEGLFSEMFATDAMGLNVAQSTITSDYWQGDEEKFTETYSVGPDAIYLGEIEQDESTQTYQSQVSITIVDPDSGEPIGSITAGVDLSML
ncbi:hypothetical protein [Devosia sp.]|uniref:hypothetical protein n=1 Tax=Devosia sp. TaxID=1871048 RepID=UPI003A8E7158